MVWIEGQNARFTLEAVTRNYTPPTPFGAVQHNPRIGSSQFLGRTKHKIRTFCTADQQYLNILKLSKINILRLKLPILSYYLPFLYPILFLYMSCFLKCLNCAGWIHHWHITLKKNKANHCYECKFVIILLTYNPKTSMLVFHLRCLGFFDVSFFEFCIEVSHK